MNKEEFSRLNKHLTSLSLYDSAVEPLKGLMDSCLKYGFTREEAMLIIITSLENKNK